MDVRAVVEVLSRRTATPGKDGRAVDTAWAAIAARIGEESLVARVRAEASRSGAPSPANRDELIRLLGEATARDPRFARDLDAAVGELAPGNAVTVKDGNYLGSVVSNGGGDVRIKQKVVKHVRGHPIVAATVVVALLGVLGAGGYGVVAAFSGPGEENVAAASPPSGAATAGNAPVDRSTPESTAAAFASALSRQDRAEAERVTCAEERRRVEDRLRVVGSGSFSEGGYSVMGVTISVRVLRVQQRPEPVGAVTHSARFAWVVSDLPADAPPVIREAAAKQDDWGMGLRQEPDGKWLMC
ncbi:hypothetical protein [Amycolatopsis azurea]|uniref:Uncharacterized protein n=1 Tax=Amycolatopsis azurea DSM 43854 TaxID=1238180 RepID=M2PJW0_9PSEU|nr:hypothetical protein [Amycolatopsis azurea]EMD24768.1 hypothetical protein C791_5788 [Amycolatopsis azurea DSM 43854]